MLYALWHLALNLEWDIVKNVRGEAPTSDNIIPSHCLQLFALVSWLETILIAPLD